MVFSRARGLLA
jgi:hypothetical protein